MKTILIALLVAVCSFLSGCSHTVISMGGDDHWSPGDGRYHVGISAHGASGRAYTDFTEKRVDLSITSVDRQNRIIVRLLRDIRLRAARLSWRVRWQGSKIVHITFTDENGSAGRPMRIISTYSFAYDEATGTFREVPTNRA